MSENSVTDKNKKQEETMTEARFKRLLGHVQKFELTESWRSVPAGPVSGIPVAGGRCYEITSGEVTKKSIFITLPANKVHLLQKPAADQQVAAA